MRTSVIVIAAALTLAGGAGLIATPAAGATSTVPTSLHSGHMFNPGTVLRSGSGVFVLVLSSSGELAITEKGKTVWATTPRTPSARLVMHTNGNLAVINTAGADVWQSGTGHAGTDTLVMSESGVLYLLGNGGTVWSSALGNGCTTSTQKYHVIIAISTQRARLCEYNTQVLVTPVTTGASSIGDGTPTGTWTVYRKASPTTLYPAGGGAYHVKYWMPYSGPYGMHDSPWQTFAYGSSLYKTKGSHGCVHFPAAAMTRLYGWAPVGTTVTIRY